MASEKSKQISVIMPAYKAESTITQAIYSVQAQTYRNWELLVIDDASPDNTADIVNELIAEDVRIRYLRMQKNEGTAAARNLGLSSALGFFIAFLDADDVWVPDKLERQVELWEQTRADILYTGYCAMDETGTTVGSPYIVPSCITYRNLLMENINCSSAMITEQSIDNLRFDGRYKHEDYVFWLSLLKKPNTKACGLPQMCVYTRSGGRNTDKLDAAKNRWIVYRESERLSITKSIWYFIHYAIRGMRKHYLGRAKHAIDKTL